MKIAITSTGTDIDSPMDPRFGRAAHILIVDTFTQSVEALDNSENVNAFKGAGIQAAARLSEKKAEALLTGFCGPNAFKTLEAAGVKVAVDITGTVRDALEAFNEGRVSFSDSPNSSGGGA
ncbi:Dinitrogenase iron-molybdenum cofactor biosynthesis protein [Candidatus Desulfarcum epimagneticum]|uniref:Dinitrogenase iron-molybdenum cofactor biosynthesis protein n=1 Tax=uncultured Desulfobacteraceae bacterium TaxID=218296 RepID=A0A484HP99_9BACT|nr:Dinitrogenase iron-molybdenum cofactor biosynthesis protein [uncultured Desulfobacteraceae bacterium]